MNVRIDDLAGIAEIAKMAGVSIQAVCSWRVRHKDFPKPLVVLRIGPIFSRRAVVAWAERKASA